MLAVECGRLLQSQHGHGTRLAQPEVIVFTHLQRFIETAGLVQHGFLEAKVSD